MDWNLLKSNKPKNSQQIQLIQATKMIISIKLFQKIVPKIIKSHDRFLALNNSFRSIRIKLT